jgi:sugar phosphate isomerase/epimerase
MRAQTADFVNHCRSISVEHMTLITPLLMQPDGLDKAVEALAAGGTRASVLNHSFAAYPNIEEDTGFAAQKLDEAIDIAAALGAGGLYLVTGGRGSLNWEQAAARFADLIAPCRRNAEEKGVRLMVEPASGFNADIHFVHTLDDTIRLAQIAGIGVCLELHACWMEGGLKEKFARAMPLTGLVQVSDYVAGDRTAPCRAVPGDGMIPLERLIGDILEAGYEGLFDLELLGPRIDAEGPEQATRRAAEQLSAILVRLGA